MTIRISSGLRNAIAAKGSVRKALQNGRLYYYSGSQPSSADAAPTGTLLATFTDSHAANTAETLATGTVTLNTGSAGSVDTVTVDGYAMIGAAVPFDTSLTQTAANLATEINRYENVLGVRASSAGAVVTLTAPRSSGTQLNSMVVAVTVTTLTATPVNMSGGVAPVNGLKFEDAADGAIDKLGSQAWEGSGAANGTVGWFRLVGSVADSLGADTTASQIRLDGSVGTSGANLNLSSTTIAIGAIQTITAFSVNVPANA